MPAHNRPHVRPAARAPRAAIIALAIVSMLGHAGRAADTIESSGIAMIPHDAAFVSSTLRLREQLLGMTDHTFGRDTVSHVYFTEYLVQ